MKSEGAFFKLVTDFGGTASEKADDDDEAKISSAAADTKAVTRLTKKHVGKAAGTGKLEVRLKSDIGD